MNIPQPATNWYGTRKHWSRDLSPEAHGLGRKGHSVCSTDANPVQVWDQDAVNDHVERYSLKKRTVISALPECKKCYRILAKEAGQ